MRNATALKLLVLWAAMRCIAGCTRQQPTRPHDPLVSPSDAGRPDDAQAPDAQAPASASALASVLASASATAAAAATPAVSAASSAPPVGSLVPLPQEPWYSDKPERTEECVAPRAAHAPHFPAPFEMCDPREEAWHSPPGGHELHFHYRFFSVALTNEKRRRLPGVCCYLIFEFPRSR